MTSTPLEALLKELDGLSQGKEGCIFEQTAAAIRELQAQVVFRDRRISALVKDWDNMRLEASALEAELEALRNQENT